MNETLIIDAEFERLIPPLSKIENELLEENLLQEGCREPITVWNNIILDGHHRYIICRKHRLLYQVASVPMESRDEAIAWICKNQMGRRNINDETRRYLIGKRYEAEKRIGAHNADGSNQHAKMKVAPTFWGQPQKSEVKHGISVKIGNEYRLSHATIEKYARYARAVDRISAVDYRMIPRVLSGDLHVGQDTLVDLAALSDRQIQFVTRDIPDEGHSHLDRMMITESLSRNVQFSMEETNTPFQPIKTVKDMPPPDPDAEVSSLALTIPSWQSSITRTLSHADMQSISISAKSALRQELISLMRTIENILGNIQEG